MKPATARLSLRCARCRPKRLANRSDAARFNARPRKAGNAYCSDKSYLSTPQRHQSCRAKARTATSLAVTSHSSPVGHRLLQSIILRVPSSSDIVSSNSGNSQVYWYSGKTRPSNPARMRMPSMSICTCKHTPTATSRFATYSRHISSTVDKLIRLEGAV